MTDRPDADAGDADESPDTDALWRDDEEQPDPDVTETVPLDGRSAAAEDWDGDGDATEATPGVPDQGRDRPTKQPVGASEPATGGVSGPGIPGDDGPEPATPGATDSRPDAASPDAASPDAVDDEMDTGAEPPQPPAADMTMALTYGAATRLADPAAVFASAREWADWVGLVGDVSAPDIHMFQRDHDVEADFFNGTDVGPVERLQNVTETSKFYANRLVVVGPPADERIASAADWEFVPLAEAAEKAGWELKADPDSSP